MPRPQRKGRAKRELTYADLSLNDKMNVATGKHYCPRGTPMPIDKLRNQAELDQFIADNIDEVAPIQARDRETRAEAEAAYQAWLATQPKYVPTGEWD